MSGGRILPPLFAAAIAAVGGMAAAEGKTGKEASAEAGASLGVTAGADGGPDGDPDDAPAMAGEGADAAALAAGAEALLSAAGMAEEEAQAATRRYTVRFAVGADLDAIEAGWAGMGAKIARGAGQWRAVTVDAATEDDAAMAQMRGTEGVLEVGAHFEAVPMPTGDGAEDAAADAAAEPVEAAAPAPLPDRDALKRELARLHPHASEARIEAAVAELEARFVRFLAGALQAMGEELAADAPGMQTPREAADDAKAE